VWLVVHGTLALFYQHAGGNLDLELMLLVDSLGVLPGVS